MSTEENKATVRRAIEESWNQGHADVFDELNASNFIYHDPGIPDVRTTEDYKRWVTEGDKVAMRWTFRGTHTGALVTPIPLPATGKQITVSGISIIRFAGEKAVEAWNQGDNLGELQQLGVIPMPG